MQAVFEAYRDVVRPEWIDDNGHMNMGYYLVVFDMASTPFFHFIGLTREHRRAHGITTFAAESHILFRQEVREGDPLRFESRLLDFDARKIHFAQRMFHEREGFHAASVESLSLHIDQARRRVAPMHDAVLARLAEVKAADAARAPWPEIGRSLGVSARRPDY